jgi:DNA anti-recombination protein RmuC
LVAIANKELSELKAQLNSLSESKKKYYENNKDAVKELQGVLSNVITEAKNMTDVANISGEYFRKLEV